MSAQTDNGLSVLKLAEKLAEPAHFLVVDDEPDVCACLANALENLGCRATVVHDGKSALNALGNTRFAGVLLDIYMEGINGFDVIEEMKRSGLNVPVLVITGYPKREIFQLIETYGVLAVVVKPFSTEELTLTLKRYFSIFNVRHHR